MEGLAGVVAVDKARSRLERLVCSMVEPLVSEGPDVEQGYLMSDAHAAVACAVGRRAQDCLSVRLGGDTVAYLLGHVNLLASGESASFLSRTDCTRAVIQQAYLGYQETGPSSFRSLSGSFLLLFYEEAHNRFIIVSDRMASRPLFYCRHDRGTTFATDIRAVLTDPNVSRKLDLPAVAEFLRFTMIFEDRTLYQNIHSLLPATALVITPSSVTSETYWRMSFQLGAEDESYYVGALADVCQRATSRLVPEGDGIGLMLSGGMDSRTIAAALRHAGKSFTAITFGELEKGNDEVTLARRVARSMDVSHIFIKRDPDYYAQIAPRAVEISGGLYSMLHAHMLGLHDQLRAYGITTLITGWAIDVPLSGSYLPNRQIRYGPGRLAEIPALRPLGDVDEVVESWMGASPWPHTLALPSDETTAQLMAKPYQEMWHEWPRQVLSAIAGRVAERAAGNLHNVHDLIQLDNFSKFRSFLLPLSCRYGCRERCPLFEADLLGIYLRMPPHMRFHGRVYRKALALADPQLAKIPEYKSHMGPRSPEFARNIAITLMPFIRQGRLRLRRALRKHRQYPAAAFHSYSNPQILLRKTGLRATAESVLLGGSWLDLGITEPATVRRMLELHMQGRAKYGEHLGALMTLALWLEQWS